MHAWYWVFQLKGNSPCSENSGLLDGERSYHMSKIGSFELERGISQALKSDVPNAKEEKGKGRKENLQGNESARSLIYGRMNNISKKRAINKRANHAWNNESPRCNTSLMSLRYSDALRRKNFICNSQNTQWQKTNTRRIKCPKGANTNNSHM